MCADTHDHFDSTLTDDLHRDFGVNPYRNLALSVRRQNRSQHLDALILDGDGWFTNGVPENPAMKSGRGVGSGLRCSSQE